MQFMPGPYALIGDFALILVIIPVNRTKEERSSMLILNTEVETIQDSELGTLYGLAEITEALKPLAKTYCTSFSVPTRKKFPEEFVTIKNKLYATKRGVEKLIKAWNTPEAHKLQEQFNDIATNAMNTGFLAEGNFLSTEVKSKYLAYNPSLGAVVSTRQIAECFGKAHFNVLQDFDKAIIELQEIELKKQSIANNSLQAFKSNYNHLCITGTDSFTKLPTREILVDEGLFNYVVLGYTGKAAKFWKVTFIDEFLRLRLEMQKGLMALSIAEAYRKVTSKLYVFYDASTPGVYKIGITERATEARLKEINQSVTSSIKILWESPEIINAKELEKDCHGYFESKRIKSEDNPSLQEWFLLTEQDLGELQGLLKFKFRTKDIDILALT